MATFVAAEVRRRMATVSLLQKKFGFDQNFLAENFHGVLLALVSLGLWGSMKVARAFTLIELLVVIAILAILAGLLLPVLSRVQEKARAVYCLNNLRKWGTATQLYISENNFFLPPEGFPNPGSASELEKGWYCQ